MPSCLPGDNNPCFHSRASCSACCGLQNLRLDPDLQINHKLRRQWLEDNTTSFLGIELIPENIVRFRKDGESGLEGRSVDPTTYICPFIGLINGRSGCLLHPTGSPHPQISDLGHPQNFGFYGESICLGYDCRSKETRSHPVLPPDSVTPESYPALIANHNLHRVIQLLLSEGMESSVISTMITEGASAGLPVTSFEPVIPDSILATDPAGWLQKLLNPASYPLQQPFSL